MTIEQLMPFCSKDSTRTITKPFSDEQYTYATDGHVMIRVDRIEDVPISSPVSIDDLKKYFDCVPSIPMPTIEIKKVDCKMCGGTGKVTRCPECDGEGEVGFDNAYNSYECECKTCDGDGFIGGDKDTCDHCNGEGKVISPSQSISIGGVLFSNKTLAPIITLTNISFFVRGEQPATFSFDGGMGIVMPVRS